jgi:hypothetical protein
MASSQVVPKVVLIQKNNPAPFDGYLMPETKLQELETDSLNAKLYKEELRKEEGSLPPPPIPAQSKVIWWGVGVLTGIVTCSLLRCF